MRRLVLVTSVLTAAMISSGGAQTVAPPSGGPDVITVERAWAGATPGRARTGAVYLTIIDRGAPDRIVGVSTPVAETAGIHQSSNENGIMRMRPVPSLPVTPGAPVILAPGGYHIMLTGLRHPLEHGQTFPVTLSFERAAPVTATVTVERAGASALSDRGAMGKHGMDTDGHSHR